MTSSNASSVHTDDAEIDNPSCKDVRKENSYWHAFYSKLSVIPAVPSQFCVLVSTEVGKSTPIVEFGCGNGRDSIFFAYQGFSVVASDLCKEAIATNQGKSCHGAKFLICDCTNDTGVEELIQEARQIHPTVVVYNRFFLHSIDKKQEHLFLTALGRNLVEGDKLYMEFRCNLDETLPKVYGKGHYRRYVNTKKLVMFLKSVGFQIEYEKTGQGMAKYRDEDPFVSRIIAVKDSCEGAAPVLHKK